MFWDTALHRRVTADPIADRRLSLYRRRARWLQRPGDPEGLAPDSPAAPASEQRYAINNANGVVSRRPCRKIQIRCLRQHESGVRYEITFWHPGILAPTRVSRTKIAVKACQSRTVGTWVTRTAHERQNLAPWDGKTKLRSTRRPILRTGAGCEKAKEESTSTSISRKTRAPFLLNYSYLLPSFPETRRQTPYFSFCLSPTFFVFAGPSEAVARPSVARADAPWLPRSDLSLSQLLWSSITHLPLSQLAACESSGASSPRLPR